ncbi:BatA domain-containing protein [Luteolibacter algae]|uniref:BatA domain-containing protein n=1 Tax=Luteolibacter algae TaxID=454151 RepID=A0ABW5D3C5_9BACT
MLFLNPWLLLGLAGILIPILIHLVRQQVAKPVPWGAMRFLIDTISVRRKKMEWEDLLLMASRCLLITLIVLTLARPLITPDSAVPWMIVLPAALAAVAAFGSSFVIARRKIRWIIRSISTVIIVVTIALVIFEKKFNLKRFEASGHRDVALVIDASSSMKVSRNGSTVFQRAIAEAKQVVLDSPRGTAFTVVLSGSAPEAITASPLTHRTDVLGVLDALQPVGGGSFHAQDALGMATLALHRGTNANKEIIVFTDAQRTGWRFDNPGSWNNLRKTWDSMPNAPKLLLRVFDAPEKFKNVALNNLELSRGVVGTDREVLIRASIENTGSEALTPGPVTVEINGERVGEVSVGLLTAGQKETLEFRHLFQQSGPQLVQLRVDAKDDLADDDTLNHVVNVKSKIRVLIIEGRPDAAYFDRAAGYLALALAPDPSLGSRQQSLMDPEVISLKHLVKEDFDGVDVIILADVESIPQWLSREFAFQVLQGTGLVTIAGPSINASFYNSWEGTEGKLMPMKLGEEIVEENGTRPALATFNHESLKLFTPDSDLANAQIMRWRSVTPYPGSETQAAAFTNGDTFLAAKKYGNGRSLLITSGLDARSGGLAAKNAFVPLIHELTMWAAGRGPELNVDSTWQPVISLTRSRSGLSAEYFSGRRISENDKSAVRIDPVINFNWKGVPPLENISQDRFSIRWTGKIVAHETGDYLISTKVNGSISVRIGGYEEMRTSNGEHDLGTIHLESGKPLDFQALYTDGAGEADIRLYWTTPQNLKEIIPSIAFIPGIIANSSEPLAVTDPRGAQKVARLRQGQHGRQLVIDGSAIPGVYSIYQNDFLRRHFPELPGGRMPVVVNRNARESTFSPMSENDLEMIRKNIDLVQPGSVEDILAVMEGKGFGRELWKLLATATLGFFFLESILARWVSGARGLSDNVRVEFDQNSRGKGGFR